MKKIGPPGFILLGFLAAGFITVDLLFRFFFVHTPMARKKTSSLSVAGPCFWPILLL